MRFRVYKGKNETAPQSLWTRSQRDAYYYGYIAGVEMTLKKYALPVKTNLIGSVEHYDLVKLRKKLNYLSLEQGVSVKEKPYFWEGVKLGVQRIDKEQKEKHSQ